LNFRRFISNQRIRFLFLIVNPQHYNITPPTQQQLQFVGFGGLETFRIEGEDLVYNFWQVEVEDWSGCSNDSLIKIVDSASEGSVCYASYSFDEAPGLYQVVIRYYDNPAGNVGDTEIQVNGVRLDRWRYDGSGLLTRTTPSHTFDIDDIVRLKLWRYGPDLGYIDYIEFQPYVMAKKISKWMPREYELYQNYPNPFNPSTTISFDLPEKQKVSLKIYNLVGQLLKEIVNTELDAGRHHYSWKPENVTSGLYFYELTAGNFRKVNKMMFVK
jgi:hypothetical protein